jgi:hypothetical protein
MTVAEVPGFKFCQGAVVLVKSKRMAWLGHMMQTEEKKNTQKSTGVETNR